MSAVEDDVLDDEIAALPRVTRTRKDPQQMEASL